MARKQAILPTTSKQSNGGGVHNGNGYNSYTRLAADPDSDPYSPHYRNSKQSNGNGNFNGYSNGAYANGGGGNLLLTGGSTTFGDAAQSAGASRLMFV